MAPTPEKEHLMEEVSKHNKVEDCWLVIGNDATGELSVWTDVYHMYDMTQWRM